MRALSWYPSGPRGVGGVEGDAEEEKARVGVGGLHLGLFAKGAVGAQTDGFRELPLFYLCGEESLYFKHEFV